MKKKKWDYEWITNDRNAAWEMNACCRKVKVWYKQNGQRSYALNGDKVAILCGAWQTDRRNSMLTIKVAVFKLEEENLLSK